MLNRWTFRCVNVQVQEALLSGSAAALIDRFTAAQTSNLYKDQINEMEEMHDGELGRHAQSTKFISLNPGLRSWQVGPRRLSVTVAFLR